MNTCASTKAPVAEGHDPAPRVARMKERLLTAPYEICMARARFFTESYKETEGMNPAIRNALALRRTLQKQKIFIYDDERLAGSKTERFLAGPLSVERGDFLRSLQLEMEILHLKRRPFLISEADKKLFYDVILPYWDGRTVRDCKAREWKRQGLINTGAKGIDAVLSYVDAVRSLLYIGAGSLKKILGANLSAGISRRKLGDLFSLRYEYAFNNPTPAIYCFDIQGHLCLGVDKAVQTGFAFLISKAKNRLRRLEKEEPENEKKADFLKAVVISLEAAIEYSERFAAEAQKMALAADCHEEKQRLTAIAANCRRVPRHKPETFHEALQAIWMAQVVGEIQYGTHDVFAPGRVDQFLFPFFMADMKEGRLTEPEAIALVQEYFLKLSANIEPIPEAGTETNAVLGNSQHCVTIGGVKPDGRDGTNELSLLILKAYEQMKGSVNQLCVRIHRDSAPEFLKSTIRVFRKTSGIAIYNDDAVIRGLTADGFGSADARNYTIVGCVETCGQADTHPCPGGHELVLPAVLMLTLTAGRFPPPALGQQQGFDSGNPGRFTSFDLLLDAFRRQLGHQIHVLVRAAEGKDKAHSELLPAPYVSALMKGCIENVKDIVHGGAKYNFTSIDIRGLATLVDSLAAIRMFVYERTGLSLERITRILLSNFKDSEELRQRIITEAPKYGTGDAEADALGYRVIDWIYGELRRYRNTRGGRFRACYYSYGNHVIDGFMLGATPDGRLKGEPISNGVAPSNLVKKKYSPLDPMKTVALFEPEKVSSGVSLNLRFHPGFIRHENGLEAFSSIIKTYFALGGMHIQPNIVSSEILRDAQKNPDRHRDLVVKVSGYSAYFTDLGASIQEDIIARAEFGGQLPCS